LANEEVVAGKHERCDTVVEKKQLKQWVLKITDYADKLIDGLDAVDYPSNIADQQINWIGRSVGADIDFRLSTLDVRDKEVNPTSNVQHPTSITVFTTRPDTLYGATYMVLAPEHPLVQKITSAENKKAVDEYVCQSVAKSDIDRQADAKDKTGVFTGAYAVNPANNEKIPIWIADYVLMGYGTGTIMAVPAHDDRDFAFAKKFDQKIVRVIKNEVSDDECSSGEGLMINSADYNGSPSQEAREKIVADLAKKGVAREKVQYKLRDWIFSRQHYWGEPIPIIHCQKCGAVPVPTDQLPVTLPEVQNYEPTDNGESPLAAIGSWVNTTCPKCGGPAKRETDTMPNWAGSSWYYLRYYDAKNNKEFAAKDKLNYWGEVDLYLGGMEHTTLHLLYSRFWHKFLYDQKLVPTQEPYKARRGQGIILAEDGNKMSKSKGNVVDPISIVNQGYGADALKLAIAFIAPYEQTTAWKPEIVPGTHRFLSRVWTLVQEYKSATGTAGQPKEGEILDATHHCIYKVSNDLENLNFNTAISALMEFTNELYLIKEQDKFATEAWEFALLSLVKLLAPFAPHITEELWQQLGQKGSVHVAEWPVHDDAYLVKNTVKIAIQINGKLRGEIEMPYDSEQSAVEEAAKLHENATQYLKDDIKKVFYVPNKLISFVV
jgi:leucyl-tRNA synthetase